MKKCVLVHSWSYLRFIAKLRSPQKAQENFQTEGGVDFWFFFKHKVFQKDSFRNHPPFYFSKDSLFSGVNLRGFIFSTEPNVSTFPTMFFSGQRLTELLKQNQYKPMDVAVQVCVIYCGVRGHLDAITPEQVTDFEEKFVDHITSSQQGKKWP